MLQNPRRAGKIQGRKKFTGFLGCSRISFKSSLLLSLLIYYKNVVCTAFRIHFDKFDIIFIYLSTLTVLRLYALQEAFYEMY